MRALRVANATAADGIDRGRPLSTALNDRTHNLAIGYSQLN